MTRFLTFFAAAALAFVALTPAAGAMTIEKIVSPSGIPAWLVREDATPLVALNYAFHGGSSQDEADKAGTANLAADLLDEGAGDLDSTTFHKRLENHAIDMSFQVGRDYFHGSLRTLNDHRDEAFDLLGLALTKPRFDADAVERVRGQMMAMLRRETTNPEQSRQPDLVAYGVPASPLRPRCAGLARDGAAHHRQPICAITCAAPSPATN